MKKFTRKFAARMLLEVGLFGLGANILLQTQFQEIEIDREISVLPLFYILPIITAAAVSIFTMLMAKHNTNVLRRYEFALKPSREYAFYRIFAVIMILIAVADGIFLLQKCLPFLDSALAYAIKDAQIKNETPEFRRQAIAELNKRYGGYKTAAYVSTVIFCVLQAAVYLFGAVKLVGVYQNPPDYWSGKKRKTKK